MQTIERGERIIQDAEELTGALLLAREALEKIAALIDDPTDCRDVLDLIERIRQLVDHGLDGG